MLQLMARQDFFAHTFRGTSYDCGSKVGFLTANIAFALDRGDIRAPLLASLKALLQEETAICAPDEPGI